MGAIIELLSDLGYLAKGETLMTNTYRLGAIGFAHMHINSLLSRFDELPSSGVADTTIMSALSARN